jgi:succinate dehydrogenase / fumarate reductase, cytochrome b subunit
MSRSERPLSPHLQVYRWELTMLLSILHRISGAALTAGTLLLAWWLIAAAAGPDHYQRVYDLLAHPIGLVVLVGFTFGLFLHFANGIRHLAWDIGWGFDIPAAFATGWAVFVFTVLATALVWGLIWLGGGA